MIRPFSYKCREAQVRASFVLCAATGVVTSPLRASSYVKNATYRSLQSCYPSDLPWILRKDFGSPRDSAYSHLLKGHPPNTPTFMAPTKHILQTLHHTEFRRHVATPRTHGIYAKIMEGVVDGVKELHPGMLTS